MSGSVFDLNYTGLHEAWTQLWNVHAVHFQYKMVEYRNIVYNNVVFNWWDIKGYEEES